VKQSVLFNKHKDHNLRLKIEQLILNIRKFFSKEAQNTNLASQLELFFIKGLNGINAAKASKESSLVYKNHFFIIDEKKKLIKKYGLREDLCIEMNAYLIKC